MIFFCFFISIKIIFKSLLMSAIVWDTNDIFSMCNICDITMIASLIKFIKKKKYYAIFYIYKLKI